MQRAALDHSERNVVVLTDADMENIARIRAAAWRGRPTAADVVAQALELAADDADCGGVGFLAISNEQAYRRSVALWEKNRDVEKRVSGE